jgi:hypothetical protein
MEIQKKNASRSKIKIQRGGYSHNFGTNGTRITKNEGFLQIHINGEQQIN